MPPRVVLVPMQSSTFILNEKVCDPSLDVKIAPVSQPNYTFLRLSNNMILPDILDEHGLTSASPAALNSRVTDLGTGKLRRNRVGVHLHWILPRAYRSAPAASPSANEAQAKRKAS